MSAWEKVAGVALAAVILAAFLSMLPGCAVMTPAGTIPVSEKATPAEQAAQTAINEANVLLIAVANVIGQNVVDGITPKADAQKQIDQVRAYAVEVDKAKKLLDAGKVVSAKDQAELTRKLIIALHREVAARARKQ